jgi:outer membrane protein OmpA-like peptidoglycan-associated protein
VKPSLRASGLGTLASLALSLATSTALAVDIIPHGSLGGAAPLTDPQSREFGFGGRGLATLELGMTKALGVELSAGGLLLAQGQAPEDPRFEWHATGTAFTLFPGLRIKPWRGLWAAGGLGFVQTGNLARAGFDARIGYDFSFGRFGVGPELGYLQILQSDDAVRPEDARIATLGIHVVFNPPRPDRDRDSVFDDEDACPDTPGRRTKDPKTNGCPRTDRDNDSIYDDEDACPDTPGRRTQDPKTNGCPRTDRDGDGVYDDEDACPDKPGIRTPDPKTNGCPRSDRDGDRVYDDEDACPDVAGIPTNDPKTNGCPRGDRDKDGVYDDEDACPDIAGLRTEDPKTNGCPPADGSVHIEGERIVLDDVILFDLDSPRVRHASWPGVEKVAKFILKTGDVLEVSIEGHADAVGSDEYNLRLSKARAESVRTLLIRFGVPADNIKAEAFGRSRLKINTSHAERQNRRVEFWITRTRSGGKP